MSLSYYRIQRTHFSSAACTIVLATDLAYMVFIVFTCVPYKRVSLLQSFILMHTEFTQCQFCINGDDKHFFGFSSGCNILHLVICMC